MKAIRFTPALTRLAAIGLVAMLTLLRAPQLRAAEAYYVIDAGFVVGVDTQTGATLTSFNYGVSGFGPGGLQFSSRDSLWILTADAGAADRAYRYVPTGPNTWAKSETISQPSLFPNLAVGKGLALQSSGLLLAIGQNSHDLWEVQRIHYSPNIPGSLTVGRVRSFDPLRFPTHVAASPLATSYATWFFNGTMLVNNNGVDQFATPGFSNVEGICYDYTGYPYTDPGTQVTTTHSLLYVSDRDSVRRYDAATFQPYGKPSDRSNPVLISQGTGGMTRFTRIAVDADTGTLFALGQHPNYKDAFNFLDIVLAGFSTVDGTARGLGGSTTDPVVYHRPSGNSVFGLAIRPGVQVQQYDGGSHTLGSSNFSDPGKLLSLVNTGATPATVELPAESRHLEIGGVNRISGLFSNVMSAVSSVGSISSIISAAMNKNGALKVSSTSTVNVSTGVTARDGGIIEVQAGGTLNCPSGSVVIGVGSRLRAASLIAAQSVRAESGGTIAPGASPGQMTVQGDVELLAGSTLELEIAGTQAGVTHDLVTVQNAGTVSLNGNVVPQLTGGFTPQTADTFTVLTSNIALSATIQNLASGRVLTANGRGSFAVSVVNSGRDLQLSGYQPVSALQAWQNLYFTSDQLANPAISGDEADPDLDGCKNLLEFALNTNPLNGNTSGKPAVALGASGAPVLTFPRYAGGVTSPAGYDAEGARYIIERSTTLGSWIAVQLGSPEIASWSVTPAGDGIMEIVGVEFNSSAGPRNFLRLRAVRP